MRLLVTGDRNWTDKEVIRREMSQLEPGILIQGGARGADRLSAEVGRELGWEIEEYRANWVDFGRAAGPIRNQQMLTEGKPDQVLAFHPDLSKSKGTKDMVRRARKAGLLVKIVSR
jgi:hypothetical protein